MNDLARETVTASPKSLRLDFNTPALLRKRRIRALKDHLARWLVSIGGMALTSIHASRCSRPGWRMPANPC